MEVRERLVELFGRNNVVMEEGLSEFSTDKTGIKGSPVAAVLVESEEMVLELVRFCSREKVPLTPQGGLTGYSGGAVPLDGVALNFRRMNRIVDIDEKNLFAVVEPGVVNKALKDAVLSYGLFYPPDPASLEESFIGGNVGENASGPVSYKYGSTREYVKGLRMVFMNGLVFEYGGKLFKNEAGYNLLGLMVGSEGTLSIWTKIYLRLLPAPEDSVLLYATFRKPEDAAEAIVAVHSSSKRPTAMEFMDGMSIKAVEKYLGRDIPGDVVLYVFIDGSGSEVAEKGSYIKELLFKKGALEVELARGSDMDELWRVRRSLSPALNSLRDGKINEDVVVPLTEMPAFVRFLEDLAGRKKIVMGSFGHAGEGNLHVNVMFNTEDAVERRLAEEAVSEIMSYVSKVGGSPTGEHGIGLSKKGFMGLFFSKGEMDLLKSIKRALDPDNLLNPGKIFP